MPAYTHTAGAQQGATSASMNVPYPALSAGDLLLCILTVKDFNGASSVTTAPSGFTLLSTSSPGTYDAIWLYGKIASGSESGTIAVDTTTTGGQQAFIVKFPAPSGYTWPAIATAHVASTENSIAGSSNLTYGARTISANGNLGIQIGKEPVTGTVTAVATTSGFTQVSWLQTDTYVGAVQYIQISGNIAQNAVAMTGNSGTSTTGTLTAEFAPALAAPDISIDDSAPNPGDAIVITNATGDFQGTVTVELTDNNGAYVDVSAAVTGSGATRTLTLPAVTSFDDANATWEKIRWNQTLTLRVADSGGNDTTTLVITPPVLDHFDALGASPVYPVTGYATSDDSYVHIVSGDGEGLPVLADLQGSTIPTVVNFMLFDISADKWLTARAETFDVASVTLDGEYADAFTGANDTAIGSHTPDADAVGGGYTIEKDVSTAPAVSNAVTIQSNRVRINDANEGLVIDVGTTHPDFSFDWVLQPGDTVAQFIAQVRRLDDTAHIHVYVTQAGLIRVNQRVNSANIAITGTNQTTFSGGFTANTTYRFRVAVEDQTITVYVDDVQQVQVTSTREPNALATNVGLFAAGATTFPIYFDNANVYSDYSGAARTLSFSDSTPMPGDTITLTASAVLTGTINAVTVNGVSLTPGSADTDSCTITIPAITQFDETGTAINLGFNRNLEVSMTDGTDVATGTIQIVPPVSANFGVVGIALYGHAPVGTKLNDEGYVDVVSGTGTGYPETLDYAPTTPSWVRFRVFSVQSQVWLAYTEAAFLSSQSRLSITIGLGLS